MVTRQQAQLPQPLGFPPPLLALLSAAWWWLPWLGCQLTKGADRQAAVFLRSKLSGNLSASKERGAINFVSRSFQMKLHLLADLFILVPLMMEKKNSLLKTQEANNAPPDFKGNLLMAWKFIYKLIRQSDINTKPLVFTDPAGNACLSCRWYTEAPFLRECRLGSVPTSAMSFEAAQMRPRKICFMHASHLSFLLFCLQSC